MSIIGTFNGASIVALPTWPGPRSVEFSINDGVASVVSSFTGQTQTQQWPGADKWTGVVTLPPLTQQQADIWISFLMELRGMANAFMIGDPLKVKPSGNARGVPVADTANNLAAAQFVLTRGWRAKSFGLLLPGDYIQIGRHLHRVLSRVNSDVDGKVSIPIWPSLREALTDGQAIVLKHPVGIFRLDSNKRTWSLDVTGYTSLSFQIQEFR